MDKRVNYLVVDSGAFIKNSPVHEYAEEIFTVRGAVKEIKDKETLQRLQFLPYTLQIKEPSPESCKYVLEFSKKTGDFASLSAVDMKILALTYQLEKENVGTEHLNTKPTCKVNSNSAFPANKICGFYIPKKDQRVKTESTVSSTNNNELSEILKCEDSENEENEEVFVDAKEEFDTAENGELSAEAESDSEEEEESDDEGSWLKPENFAEIQKEMGELELDSSVTVACVTTDFSVQNVLIQMGLNVVSVDGMLIKQTRMYILRCHACCKTTNNITKQFCPSCGNKTLKRVAITVNDDGRKDIHINFRRPINVRGTRYSLPTPKGGKHAVNPHLCGDQSFPQNRLSKKALQRVDVMSDDYVVRSSPFALNDVYSRAAQLGVGIHKSHHFFRRNPNTPGKCTGNRKK